MPVGLDRLKPGTRSGGRSGAVAALVGAALVRAALVRAALGASLAIVAPAQARAPSVPGTTAAVAALPIGRWEGDARLFDRTLRQRIGPITMAIELGPDLMLKGVIGESTWAAAAPFQRSPQRLEYRLKLLGATPVLEGKDHLILIISLRADGRLDADFHLKARFGLDLGMAVGHFDAQAVPKTPP